MVFITIPEPFPLPFTSSGELRVWHTIVYRPTSSKSICKIFKVSHCSVDAGPQFRRTAGGADGAAAPGPAVSRGPHRAD